MTFSISNKRRVLEITAVVITALGKFIFMDYLNWRFAFISTATVLWISYLLYRITKEPGLGKYWGFRTDNFNATFKLVLPMGLLAVASFITVGFFKETINITWHIMPILFLYPIWGTIQQFLIIALTAGNLSDIQGISLRKSVILFLSSVLFGVIHYPHVWLMVATFFLALFYGWVYLKERNLYVLGFFHGWLGAIFYYTVLNRDPFTETFDKLLN